MRFVHIAAAVLSLLSAGQAAPVTSCEDLIQPLQINGREQLLGKWIQVAESTDNRGAEHIIKTFRDSYWMKITAANGSDAVTLMGSSKALGLCITAAIKGTLENSTFRPLLGRTDAASHSAAWSTHRWTRSSEPASHSAEEGVAVMSRSSSPPPRPIPAIKLLKTSCSDCLLLQPPENMFESALKGVRGLQLLSKRRNVTAAELEEFKKQAECLNLLQPFDLNPEADVCPEPPSQQTENTDDIRLFINGQITDFENFQKNITSSVGGQENLIKMLSDALSKQE